MFALNHSCRNTKGTLNGYGSAKKAWLHRDANKDGSWVNFLFWINLNFTCLWQIWGTPPFPWTTLFSISCDFKENFAKYFVGAPSWKFCIHGESWIRRCLGMVYGYRYYNSNNYLWKNPQQIDRCTQTSRLNYFITLYCSKIHNAFQVGIGYF